MVSGAPDGEKVSDKLTVTRASRELDLTSHILRQRVSLTITNEGEASINSFHYPIDKGLVDNLSHMQATFKEKGKDSVNLLTSPATIDTDVTGYKVTLPSPLSAKETITITIDTVFTNVVIPYPKEITQFDKQLVQTSANAYIFIPYPCKTQSTKIKVPNSNIESFTRISPVSADGSTINYGPYTDAPPYSHSRIAIHYENNNPFLAVTSLERIIQVSHWGVIQVEEYIRVRHTGAVLKGSFSRFDYQRNPNSGLSAVKSYTTLLPAAAQDVYYRDEIGNISTSHLRNAEDFTELLIRPRFPLFGGWQTYYYVGYNVPSYEYLYHRGNSYLLNMRLIDHVFDDQVVDVATVKIILPEGAKNVHLNPPYEVKDQSMSVHHTYLDTVGRPTITVKGYNLVEQHIVEFQLMYNFESYLLLQEPLLLISALFVFFLLIIGLVRLDFSITKDPEVLAQQQASVLKENIITYIDNRFLIVTKFLSAVDTFKKKNNAGAFKSSATDMFERFVALGKSIDSEQDQLKKVDSEGAGKVMNIQKKLNEMYETLTRLRSLVDQVMAGRTNQQHYAKEEDSIKKKLQQIQSEVEAIVSTL
jgi:oligosaccharyltransferase complex subunit alpha (ribophorin I)